MVGKARPRMPSNWPRRNESPGSFTASPKVWPSTVTPAKPRESLERKPLREPEP